MRSFTSFTWRGGRALALLALVAGVGCRSPARETWQATVYAKNPLVGRVFDTACACAISQAALFERLSRREFVLLGEKHDNPDHHRLQARVLGALLERGRRPAVAFEMLSVDVTPELERLRARTGATPDALREAVRWDDGPWPAFSLYAPVFETALRAGLPIVAADLAGRSVASLRAGGIAALGEAERARLELDAPLPSALQRDLEADVRAAHCGHAPDALVARMVEVQRARDAQLMRALERGARLPGADGAVLIAGAQHIRRDRGVPRNLERGSAPDSLASLAFLEVSGANADAAEELGTHASDTPLFDYVWFTPRLDDRDPCQKFEEQLKPLRGGSPEARAPSRARPPP